MAALSDSVLASPAGDAGNRLSEAACLWTSACDAWLNYLGRLAAARGPIAVLEAGADLTSESLQICDRATSLRLRGAGVREPLLTDG